MVVCGEGCFRPCEEQGVTWVSKSVPGTLEGIEFTDP